MTNWPSCCLLCLLCFYRADETQPFPNSCPRWHLGFHSVNVVVGLRFLYMNTQAQSLDQQGSSDDFI